MKYDPFDSGPAPHARGPFAGLRTVLIFLTLIASGAGAARCTIETSGTNPRSRDCEGQHAQEE